MAMNDPIDFDFELERLADDSDNTPTGMDDPMDLDWDFDRPLADNYNDIATAMNGPGLLQFASIAGGDLLVFTIYWECRLRRSNINLFPKSVRSGTTTLPLVKPTPTAVISICPKCGSSNKSGKRTCCARGGAWFKNCGDAGNPKFDHTWAEGLRACRSGL